MQAVPLIALRVYGEFVWPFGHKGPQDISRKAQGTLSIEYRQGADNWFHAFLLWEPKGAIAGPAGVLKKLAELQAKDVENRKWEILLDKVDAKEECRFLGGWYCELNQFTKDAPNPAPKVQLAASVPLLYDEPAKCWSVLHLSKADIEFQCQIPGFIEPEANPESAIPVLTRNLKTRDSFANIATPPVSNSGIHRKIKHVKELFQFIKESEEFPESERVRCEVEFCPQGARYTFGSDNNLPGRLNPLYLKKTGVLQNDEGRLMVELDEMGRASIVSDSYHFQMVVTLAWELKGDKFWEAAASGAPRVKVSMFTEAAWPSPDFMSANGIYTPAGLLTRACQLSDDARAGLSTTEAGLIDSVLPLVLNANGKPLTEDAKGIEVYAVLFSSIALQHTLGEPIRRPGAEQPSGGEVLCISPLSPFPPPPAEVLNGAQFKNNSLIVNTRFPQFDSANIGYRLRLQHGVPTETIGNDRLLLFFHISEPDTSNEKKSFQGRIGGLNFVGHRAGLLSQTKVSSYLAIYLPLDETTTYRQDDPTFLRVEWSFRFAANSVIPSRSDIERGNRDLQSVPLLVHPGSDGGSAPANVPFVLQALEIISSRDDRWLKANLLENSLDENSDPEAYTLLSRAPWSILRFSRQRLTRLGDEENAAVATFDSDQRTWLFKLVAPEYRYQFPPQGIGESTDKPRQLELHDINASTWDEAKNKLVLLRADDYPMTNAEIDFIRPAAKANEAEIPRRNYAVECRFTPSLDLWVRPSDLERGYFLAEWNAYDIFRQRNDFGLGVALRALRGEFLYGLAVGINPAAEEVPVSLSRVAELEALVGRMPQAKYLESTTPTAKALYRRWQRLRMALLARHERLEVWIPAYDQPRPFAPATFSQGVSFALRTTALFRAPTADDAPLVPNDQQLRISTDSGLSGGAIWPIESRVYWKELQLDPASSGGMIERVAISPTGGDADQSAKFRKGLLTIASSTRAGFVQRQRVEILGHINVFWNRAKHVIIYERTVNPSEQFAPEIDDKHQWHASRSRRAVIRKVMEYIELLEPVRSYPDDPESNAVNAGFLDSTRFQRIIFVDSSWGNDIEYGQANDPNRIRGYVIPLWNANAARKRPNVYAFPTISFVTLGEGTEERPLVPRQCANPENLYFYAQAYPLEPDPNKWKPVFDVDFGNLTETMETERAFAAGGNQYGAPFQQGDVPAGKKPSPQRVLPGHHRFTWRLVPDSGRTTLNAVRGDKPIYGNIESITFSRGSAPPVKNDARDTHLTHAPEIAAFSHGPSVVAHHVAELKRFSDELGGSMSKGQEAWFNDIKHELQGAAAALTAAGTKLKGYETDAKNIIKNLDLDSNPLNCEELKKRLQAEVHRKLLAAAREIDARQDQLLKWIKDVTATNLDAAWKKAITLTDKPRQRLILALHEVLKASKALVKVIDEAHTDVSNLAGEVEIAARIVHDAVADVDQTLAGAARRVQDILSACSATVDWTEDRYQQLRAQIRDELSGLSQQLKSNVADLCQRVGAELGPLGWVVAQAISREFSNRLDKLTEDHLQLAIAVTLPAKVPDAVSECLQAIQVARGKLADIEASVRAAIYEADKKFQESLHGAEDAVRDAADDVLSSAAVIPALIADVTDDTCSQIDKYYAQFTKLPDDLVAFVSTHMERNLPHLGQQLLGQEVIAEQAVLGKVKELCDAVDKWFKAVEVPEIFTKAEGWARDIQDAYNKLVAAGNVVANIKAEITNIENTFKGVRKGWTEAAGAAQAYSTRVMESCSRLGRSSFTTAPSSVLNLMAAATAAPEIGQLQANADRLRCAYKDLQVETSRLRSMFGKLGDALKSLGIDMPTDGLTDQFKIPDEVIQKYDISRLFPNFGGINLKGLLPDVKVPKGVKDAVKISHDFDRKQFRAWVQIDVNVRLDKRKELYSFGPFAVFLRDSTLTGLLRAEASKDTTETQTTARSEIATHIDVEVGGILMLSLEKVMLRYAQGSGLKFEFDPKGIRLQASLQFVQDTLGSLFGDEIGGMTIIKFNGIPIGLEHIFNLPTISIMAGTSGVSNIQLSNTFRLVAYPQFELTNRFNLSRPELPFIFSFFIVGGAGYVVIDASYRPLDQALTVGIECAAGGSASLGFAFGPVRGSVFIALMIAVTYRKTIRGGVGSGEGLTISVVLVIAGNVSLWGIVDVYLGLLLRMTYRESGAIDALGSLSVKIKICRFITLRYSTSIEYKLKGGNSETKTTSDTSVSVDHVKELEQNAKSLQGARK